VQALETCRLALTQNRATAAPSGASTNTLHHPRTPTSGLNNQLGLTQRTHLHPDTHSLTHIPQRELGFPLRGPILAQTLPASQSSESLPPFVEASKRAHQRVTHSQFPGNTTQATPEHTVAAKAGLGKVLTRPPAGTRIVLHKQHTSLYNSLLFPTDSNILTTSLAVTQQDAHGAYKSPNLAFKTVTCPSPIVDVVAVAPFADSNATSLWAPVAVAGRAGGNVDRDGGIRHLGVVDGVFASTQSPLREVFVHGKDSEASSAHHFGWVEGERGGEETHSCVSRGSFIMQGNDSSTMKQYPRDMARAVDSFSTAVPRMIPSFHPYMPMWGGASSAHEFVREC